MSSHQSKSKEVGTSLLKLDLQSPSPENQPQNEVQLDLFSSKTLHLEQIWGVREESLVYAALEYRIRQGMEKQEVSVPDQKGKPTKRPTARWVFHLFTGIHVLHLSGQELILNLKSHHQDLLRVLGESYLTLYRSKPT